MHIIVISVANQLKAFPSTKRNTRLPIQNRHCSTTLLTHSQRKKSIMSDRRRQPNNNNSNRNGGGGRRGRGGRGGRNSGRSGRGRGGRSQQQQQDYSWTSGGGGGVGGGGYNDNNNNNDYPEQEPEDFPHETQSGLLFGLSDQIVVPGSVNPSLVQGEILVTLQRLPPDICNLMLAHFDKCAREGGIRNKSAYLLGIINSGPRMGLPIGVVVPASVKFSLMQGVVLDDLTALPIKMINTILGEFDTDMRQRGNQIHDRYSFLAEIIRNHKSTMPADVAAAVTQQQQQQQQQPSSENHHNQLPNNSNMGTATSSATSGDNNTNNSANSKEMEDTLALLNNSMKRVQLLTESVSKATADLVAEKEKRSSHEAIAKSEQVLREATEARLQTALSELEEIKALRHKETTEYQTSLKFEKDRREAIDKEMTTLKEQVKMERTEKHRAEDRLSALEEMLIAERDVRDISRNGADALPDVHSADFDSDCESK